MVYNHVQNIWYFGNLARSAWLDTGIRQFPVAATYSKNIVTHENGIDDNEIGDRVGITAFITSGEFDVDDGDRFAFVSRILPDITFDGSTADSPSATLELLPLQSSGSGYNNPRSESGENSGSSSSFSHGASGSLHYSSRYSCARQADVYKSTVFRYRCVLAARCA